MLKKELEEKYEKSLKEISELKKQLDELNNVKEQNLQFQRDCENRYCKLLNELKTIDII